MLTIEDRKVTGFREKPPGDGARINGGFFVLVAGGVRPHRRATRRCGSASRSSVSPHDGQLSAFLHDGFWQPMDHLRDKLLLEELWNSGSAPWKVWKA